jgi:hypothetical protein
MSAPIIPALFTILFKPTQTIVDSVTIEEVNDGTRDRMTKTIQGGLPLGVLTEEGGIFFRVQNSRKDWFVKFSDFNFIFNRRIGAK